jgi:hypothetical protein
MQGRGVRGELAPPFDSSSCWFIESVYHEKIGDLLPGTNFVEFGYSVEEGMPTNKLYVFYTVMFEGDFADPGNPGEPNWGLGGGTKLVDPSTGSKQWPRNIMLYAVPAKDNPAYNPPTNPYPYVHQFYVNGSFVGGWESFQPKDGWIWTGFERGTNGAGGGDFDELSVRLPGGTWQPWPELAESGNPYYPQQICERRADDEYWVIPGPGVNACVPNQDGV